VTRRRSLRQIFNLRPFAIGLWTLIWHRKHP
jgi:hypothetical protein